MNKKSVAIDNLNLSPMPLWLEVALGGVYYGYLKFLKTQSENHKKTPEIFPKSVDSAFYLHAFEQKEIDLLATRAGATYRGMGLVVGLFSAIIILCALLPVGITVTAEVLLVIGILKVLLMLSLFTIIFITSKLKLKERWVDLRRAAEYKRYSKLRALITLAENSQNDDVIYNLREEVMRHIGGGTECQIIYNNKKWNDYEGIETFSRHLTYGAFSISLIGAALHLIIHASWLIFLTAYVPALLGAMHAVNSFLRLSQLIDQHGEMIFMLSELRDQLPNEIYTLESKTQFISTSRKILRRLEVIDERWLNSASQQDLHPA